MSNPLEFKVNNVEWTGQFQQPPIKQFEQFHHKTIESTFDTYKIEENPNNLETKVTMKELDKLIKETQERYTFWPQEIPTYNISESPSFPPYINFEELEYSDALDDKLDDTQYKDKPEYVNYDVAEDRILIDDDGEIEYVDSSHQTHGSEVNEFQENVFVIPVYEQSIDKEIPGITEYRTQPIILTPQADDEQNTVVPSVLTIHF